MESLKKISRVETLSVLSLLTVVGLQIYILQDVTADGSISAESKKQMQGFSGALLGLAVLGLVSLYMCCMGNPDHKKWGCCGLIVACLGGIGLCAYIQHQEILPERHRKCNILSLVWFALPLAVLGYVKYRRDTPSRRGDLYMPM